MDKNKTTNVSLGRDYFLNALPDDTDMVRVEGTDVTVDKTTLEELEALGLINQPK
tara:strand:- start:5199 stop:5363 length:165 start_codon:yes stop_codon:yes gene_type:complete